LYLQRFFVARGPGSDRSYELARSIKLPKGLTARGILFRNLKIYWSGIALKGD